MNDAPLPVAHGAPLRLRVERQLGYKMAKYVMRIEAVDELRRARRRPRRLLGRPRLRVVRGNLTDLPATNWARRAPNAMTTPPPRGRPARPTRPRPVVAIDTETLGLNSAATGCAWCSSRAATASPISCRSRRARRARPTSRRCSPIRRAQDLPFRPLRHRHARHDLRRDGRRRSTAPRSPPSSPAPTPTGTGSRT